MYGTVSLRWQFQAALVIRERVFQPSAAAGHLRAAPAGAAPCVAATAESLPFEDQSSGAAMAVATIDHWQDPVAGLRKMRRVARRVVVFTHDASDPDRFWPTRDYLPEHAGLGRPAFPDRAGPDDRSPDRTGAHPVGLTMAWAGVAAKV